MSTPNPRSERRTIIADSAISIIARDGVRALTHRAIDREAGLPEGTTTYHAKTRAALLELVIDVLSSRAVTDARGVTDGLAASLTAQEEIGVDDLADAVVGLVENLASRRNDMRARYALILELADQPDLRDRLTAPGDVHRMTADVASAALSKAGLPSDVEDVEALIALTEALVLERTVTDRRPTRSDAIVRAYLRGVDGS